MANIIKYGKTPKWGINKITELNGLILDSYSESVEIKDYEQTDENGAVCGYLIYDQTRSFDMSGTLLADEGLTCHMVIGKCINSVITGIFGSMGANDGINNPSSAILKSISFSANAGGAQTFSASGTIYDFGVGVNCEQ